jgi:hypothetical protein
MTGFDVPSNADGLPTVCLLPSYSWSMNSLLRLPQKLRSLSLLGQNSEVHRILGVSKPTRRPLHLGHLDSIIRLQDLYAVV